MMALPAPKFMAAWLPTLALSISVDQAPKLSEAFIITFAGVPIPVFTCILGAIGVAAARPLAHKQESSLGWPMFILVSLIMLIVSQLWIVESHPGWLFAFVVSLGLGFAGYSMIELVGTELRDFISTTISKATETVGRITGGRADGQSEDKNT